MAGVPNRRACATEQRFVEKIYAEVEAAGYEIQFRDVATLRPFNSSGYFDEDGKKLVIATQTKNWFDLLAHEYAHFRQARAGLWIGKELDCWRDFDNWLVGNKELRADRLVTCTRTVQECERDAERQVLSWAKRYGFESINRKVYTQNANMYIFIYELARRHRTWFKAAPFDFPDFMALVPASRLTRRLDYVPHRFEEAYLDACT